MNKHQSIQVRLVYDDLTEAERRALETHLAGCAECRTGVETLRSERRLLRSIPRNVPRPGLAEELRVAARREPRRAHGRRNWRLGISAGAVAALAVVALLVAVIAPAGGTAPAAAQALLRQAAMPTPYVTPSRGDAYISYRRLDWNEVPVDAAPSLSPHLIHVRWAVRDATHFRIDLTTIRPFVDAGTLTVVTRGQSVRTYNSQTGIATVQTLPLRGLRSRLEAYLVELRFGGSYYAGIPDPIHSLGAYLSHLNQGPGGGTQSTVVGRRYVGGRWTTVIDLRPAVRASEPYPCFLTPGPGGTFPQPNSCRQYTREFGWARLWIDETRHTVLRYQEFGFPRVQNPIGWPAGYLFRVHSIAFGPPPARSLTAPQWPHVLRLPPDAMQSPLGVVGGSTQIAIPQGFVRPPFPSFPADEPGQQAYGQIGISRRLGVDVVWRHVTGKTAYYLFRWKGPVPYSTWIHGPYLLVQQRIRPSGLAPYYGAGVRTTIARCTVWTGTYGRHGLWAALARQPVTVVVSAGELSRHVLDEYVRSLSICRGTG